MSQAYFSIFELMFVRKKKNKSGVISVQVIDKSNGKYKVVKTISSSSNPFKVEKLVIQGKQWIKEQTNILELNFSDKAERIPQIRK